MRSTRQALGLKGGAPTCWTAVPTLPVLSVRRWQACRGGRAGACVLRPASGRPRPAAAGIPAARSLDLAGDGGRLRRKLPDATRDELADAFAGTDACVAPMLGLAEAPSHLHNAAPGNFIRHRGPMQLAPAPRYSRTVPALADDVPQRWSALHVIRAFTIWTASSMARRRRPRQSATKGQI